MRKLILLIAIGFGIFQYFTKHQTASITSASDAIYSDDTSVNEVSSSASSQFSCQGKTYCREMTSYEEAKFYLDNCSGVKIDGDHDGIPCESQFGRH